MKLALVLLLAASGCGAIQGDTASFDVFVHDQGGDGIDGAVITMRLSEDNDDHVCGKTDTHGRAALTWDPCEFGALRCERNAYSVMAAATGFVSGTQYIGLSQSSDAAVELKACDDGASCPEPTPCTGH